ncbi:MAG: hypothetical protein ABI390_00475 [Daejeonella sp.]
MRYSGIILILAFLVGCKSETPKKNTPDVYFDLKTYFENEAARLQSVNPAIEKTVSRNSVKQNKKIANIDWKAELSLFTASDINKPSWKDSYQKIQNDSGLIYKALDSALRTREIEIYKTNEGTIKAIKIQNQTVNRLYQSFENLLYIPDSLYQVNKKQHVLIIGENDYLIKGRFR